VRKLDSRFFEIEAQNAGNSELLASFATKSSRKLMVKLPFMIFAELP